MMRWSTASGRSSTRCPAISWQKFANLRLLYTYMFAQPGKKLLFMGGEIGQWWEWNANTSLDWHLLDYEPHRKLKAFVTDFNGLYRREASMHEVDFNHEGFEWIDFRDYERSVVSFIRRAKNRGRFPCFCLQFHSRAPPQLPHRRAEMGLLPGGLQQRLGDLLGKQRGKPGRALCRGHFLARPPLSPLLDLPPLGAVVLKPAEGSSRQSLSDKVWVFLTNTRQVGHLWDNKYYDFGQIAYGYEKTISGKFNILLEPYAAAVNRPESGLDLGFPVNGRYIRPHEPSRLLRHSRRRRRLYDYQIRGAGDS